MDDVYGTPRSPVYEEPPPYSPIRRNGTNDFFIEKSGEATEKGDGIVVRIVRSWTRTTSVNSRPGKIVRTTSDYLQHRTWPAVQKTTNHVTPVVSSASRTTWDFVSKRVWPAVRGYPLYASQFYGCMLLLLGIVPFVVYGKMMRPWDTESFYYNAFAKKTLGCGDSLGTPQNMTVEGIEALFVLDWTFGQLSFARVKTINIAWEMLVGRGIQGVYWAICYRIFTDALLRLIERHPASYETFKSISLEGAGIGSSLMLAKQLFRNRSIRTWFLFFYLLISSIYVLGIPPLLSAVAGYDGTQIAWVSIGSPDNIIPSSQLQNMCVLTAAKGKKFDEPLCNPIPELEDWYYHQQDMSKYCDCQLPNKTVLPFYDWQYYINTHYYEDANHYNIDDCNMRFPGNSKLYNSTWGKDSNYARAATWGEYNCNDTFEVTLPNNEKYSMYDLSFDPYGFCFQNKSYDFADLSASTRCLPDTANPSYAFGFSSAMLGVILIMNLTWCLSMWAVWQDAMFARLVQQGYRMSPLRAAFALTEAAKRRTGVRGEGLVLRERKLLRRELKRGKGKREATVGIEVFEEGPGGEREVEEGGGRGMRIRRKPVGGREEPDDYGDV